MKDSYEILISTVERVQVDIKIYPFMLCYIWRISVFVFQIKISHPNIELLTLFSNVYYLQCHEEKQSYVECILNFK